jgi:hypothetical protein
MTAVPLAAHASSTAGVLSQNSKITLVRTTTLDPNAVVGTVPVTSPPNDTPNTVSGDGLIPAKGNQLAMSSDQGSSTTSNGAALVTPVVQGFDVRGHPDDTKSVKGLNAFDFASTHGGFSIEPPDQMLCAGKGYVLEGVNLNIKAFTTGLAAVTPAVALETFFFGSSPSPGLSDPKCYWDSDTGHWFVTVTVPFQIPSFVLIAVSQTKSPLGAWNVYAIDTTDDGTDGTPNNPGCPCIGDQPLIGADRNAIFISTNEFGAFNNDFNGAIMYVIDKEGLATGQNSVNVQLFNLGLSVPTPDGVCDNTVGAPCWYTVQPATSPSSQYDNKRGGTEYALSALQFGLTGPIDNRIAVWAFTNTESITDDNPSVQAHVNTIQSEAYEQPQVFANQKAGPTPRGEDCTITKCRGTTVALMKTFTFPGPIQPNDDRMNQVVFANGLLWGGLNTAVQISNEEESVDPAVHNGIAYFVVQPTWRHSNIQGKIAAQGYVAVKGSDVLFPSIGVTTDGQGILAFTLTGPSFYPSAAFVKINAEDVGDQVQIAAAGKSPQDGFTEYYDFGDPLYRPRWGDYSAAVAFGGKIFFSTEYIQYPNCSHAAWLLDNTCGGTRARSSNWGTSISVFSS